MRRLGATIALDLRLQLRNGFYHAVAFVLACWFVLVTQLPDIDWGFVLPAVVLGNLVMVNFYFVAGLVLLERDEGTLEAQVVTPLADWEYLASKTATLAALSLVEQYVIVWTVRGSNFAAGPLTAGIALAAVLYTLVGFLLVARYRSINEFLLPAAFVTVVLSLPLLHYFGLLSTWPIYFHPFAAPLVLLKGAFEPVPAWQWIYGVLYSVAWAVALMRAGRAAFDRFVVAGRGGH